MTITEILGRKGFVVTAELTPPKGIDCGAVLQTAEKLAPLVDAINITDGASAVMRMGSLPLCHLLKERCIEPVLQLTCRDRNRIALQSELLNASALGVHNVLCLTGDHVALGDHPDARALFDLDSVSLLWAVQRLNSGRDLRGNPLRGATDLCAGAAVNPNASPAEAQLLKMKRKKEAGARFFQTQAIFEISGLRPFATLAEETKIPLLLGVLVLTTRRGARFVNGHVSGVRVPEKIAAAIETSKDPVETGVEIAAGLIKEARKICQGVHLMNAGPEVVRRILQEAGLK